MSKIIAKNVEHSYSPRVPNRTEPRTFDRYSIYIANNTAQINLYSIYKNKEEIKHSIIGDIEFVFPEALKFIPDERVKDFSSDFSRMSIENVVEINKKKGLKIEHHKIGKKISDFIVEDKYGKQLNIEVKSKPKQIIDLGLYDYKGPSLLLAERIRNSGLDVSQIADKVGIHYSMVQKQMRGERDITRDHAIAYGKVFGCDPADILFAPAQVPIWATVDFLRLKDGDLPYNAGELVPLPKDKLKDNYVVVPRDIYRPDVKAVKVRSEGSALDGMVLFYYATNDVRQDCIGRLSIIGDNEDDDLELFRYGQSQRYFIGILENFRGKTRLLNPDTFAKETLKDTAQSSDIVIQNVQPTFAAPIVAIVNPQQIKKDKYAEQLFRINEQAYRGQRLLEEAKLAWSAKATAEMLQLRDQQEQLKRNLENIIQRLAEEKKRGTSFLFSAVKRDDDVRMIYEEMQNIERMKHQTDKAISTLQQQAKKRA